MVVWIGVIAILLGNIWLSYILSIKNNTLSMKVFSNLTELLSRLHTERKLLHELFQARQKYNFRYEDALEFVNNERNLRLLIDYGIVRQEGEMLELEETYQRFFEEILRLNENITSSTVEENLRQLGNNIDFYLKERSNPESQRKYVNKVIRILRNIATQAANKTVELKRVVNDTYRQERNYEIKRQKLEEYQTTLESIASLIRQTERVLEERKDILDVMTPDQRIARLATDVRLRFKDIFHSLIELEHTIRDYLHQIDVYNKKIKRIRKLKYIKDQLTWEKTSTVCRMLNECSHQLLETTPYYTTRISLSFLRDTDAGLELISTARSMLSRRKKPNSVPFIPLKAEELNPGYMIEDFVNTDIIAEAFFASSQDLYTFVMTYPYERPKAKEQKVEYYTEIILNHHARLRITQDWRIDGSINYPLIYNMP